MSSVRMDIEEKNEIEFNLVLKCLDQHESEFLKKVREIHKKELSFAKKLPEMISLFQLELTQILVRMANHNLSVDEASRLINRANIFNYFTKAAFLENKIAESYIETFKNAYKNFSTKYRERVQAQTEQSGKDKAKLETQVEQLEMKKAQLEIQVEQLLGRLDQRDSIIGWLQNDLHKSEIALQQSQFENEKTKLAQDPQKPLAKNSSNHSNSMWAQKQSTVSSPEKPLEKRSGRSYSF